HHLIATLQKHPIKDRKWWLFACAAARRLWWDFLSPFDHARDLLETAERMAEEPGQRKRLLELVGDTERLGWSLHRSENLKEVRAGLGRLASVFATNHRRATELLLYYTPEPEMLALLVRDVFGNPFRPLPVVAADWQATNDRAISQVAQAIYAENDFSAA